MGLSQLEFGNGKSADHIFLVYNMSTKRMSAISLCLWLYKLSGLLWTYGL